MGAILYRFPSRHIIVIGITGTKGKTSVAELANAILSSGGAKTAVLGTLRFKIGEKNERNMKKMTMPGRFFVQKFLRNSVSAGCTHAIIEMTSEGAVQYRQRFIDMDALIFTNLAPEHIESHGSYENYRDAKLSIARTLARSQKKVRLMVANADDKEGKRFLSIPGVKPLPFSLHDANNVHATDRSITFTWHEIPIHSELGGLFNVSNILSAITLCESLGVSRDAIERGVAEVTRIEGRMERIDAGQAFPVIVDYAHTPDSLSAIYKTFSEQKKICILGNTGGGRDKWKRPVMGRIAEEHCAHIILTNEDPYDEDPLSILKEIASEMTRVKPEMILDRREAIRRGIALARETINSALIITGKGTDPYIMGPQGTKIPWDDRSVAKEELLKQLNSQDPK